MKYRNVRNNRVAQVVETNDKTKTVMLQFEDDNTTTVVTTSTLKRWYKAIEDEAPEQIEEKATKQFAAELASKLTAVTSHDEVPAIEKEIFSEDIAGDGTPLAEVGKEIAEQAKKKAKDVIKKPMDKARKSKEQAPWVAEALEYIFSKVTSMGDEIFVPQGGLKMRTFKTGGHMYAKFNYSLTSITLAVRAGTIDITPDKTVNHMFHDVYFFDEALTSENKNNICLILEHARDAQADKNSKTKKTKKEEN